MRGGTTPRRAGSTRISTSWTTSPSSTASVAARPGPPLLQAAGSRKRGKRGNAPPPLSSFKWNEVIFRSFQSGNLKQIDLEFYLKLRLPTTKRVFRFLDKRFYRMRPTRIRPPDAGLRAHRPEPILQADRAEATAPPGHRRAGAAGVPRAAGRGRSATSARPGGTGRSSSSGALGAATPIEPTAEERLELVDALAARGVASRTASELVDQFPPDRIREQARRLRLADPRTDDKRLARNPAGYLVASIREDYRAPDDYVPPAEAESARPGRGRRGRGGAPSAGPSSSPSRPPRRPRPPRPPARPTSAPDGPTCPSRGARRHRRRASRPPTPASAAGRRCSSPSASTPWRPASRANPPPGQASLFPDEP